MFLVRFKQQTSQIRMNINFLINQKHKIILNPFNNNFIFYFLVQQKFYYQRNIYELFNILNY